MREDFAEGVKVLRGIETPCNWEDFCQLAMEVLPGYVIVGQQEYNSAIHYQFHSFSVYAYEDESQQSLIGEDTFQAWIKTDSDDKVITSIR